MRAEGQAPELAARTPVQVVEAANKGVEGGKALEGCRLRSGDTVVTFVERSEALAGDDTWAKAAFVPTAQVNRREFAVIAKGFACRQALTERRSGHPPTTSPPVPRPKDYEGED